MQSDQAGGNDPIGLDDEALAETLRYFRGHVQARSKSLPKALRSRSVKEIENALITAFSDRQWGFDILDAVQKSIEDGCKISESATALVRGEIDRLEDIIARAIARSGRPVYRCFGVLFAAVPFNPTKVNSKVKLAAINPDDAVEFSAEYHHEFPTGL